jgi:dTDP-glucose 4,6-dehydratase
MSRILVTGGAGFIGSHLCEYLLKKGHEIICVDNLITGSFKNIEHLRSNKNFKVINLDVTNYINIEGKLDYVLHFASPASPIDYQQAPIQTLKVGALGTHNALGLAKAKNARFMLASTSEVYGDPLVNPQPETYWGNVNPIGVRSCYDESKRFAEAMTMAYHRVHKIDTKIARIFNTHGPRMRVNDGRVIPNFINQAITNKPLTVFGVGSQTRSFCYISDLIDGIYRLMNSKLNVPVNLGNPEEITILELAKKIVKIAKSKSKIVFKPLPADDPKTRKPDITRANNSLGWKPKVKLENGLERTIKYFKGIK